MKEKPEMEMLEINNYAINNDNETDETIPQDLIYFSELKKMMKKRKKISKLDRYTKLMNDLDH